MGVTIGAVRKVWWRVSALCAGVVVAAGFGVAGQWRGGLLGAGVIGAGIYVAPEVSEWLRERHGKAEVAEAARELLEKVSGPVLVTDRVGAAGSPARLLRADQRVVEFVDRPELGRLRAWCADPGEPVVALMTGAGGVGKTRLALRLAEDRQAAGWLCRVVWPGAAGGVLAACRAVSRGKLLLVVDYAETRPDLEGLMRAACADDGERLRVLLVARGAGEWWAGLEAVAEVGVRDLAGSALRAPVGAITGDRRGGGDLVQAAVREFARVLKVSVPAGVRVVIPDRPVPVLVLHAVALLTVLRLAGGPDGGRPVVADERVLGDLLTHEKVFWLSSRQGQGLTGPGGLDAKTASQAVAVACLVPAGDEEQAAGELRRVPGLAGSAAGWRRQIARWLRLLYPAAGADPEIGTAQWWGSIQPDLIAEQHVIEQLAEDGEFAAVCLAGLSPDQARQALTVLARGCGHDSRAAALLARALSADLPGLGVAAVNVAIQTGGPVGEILAEVAAGAASPLDTLIEIEQAIPYPTVTLARADLVLAQRIVQTLPEDTGAPDRAGWLDTLGIILRQAGRPAEALPVTEEAVTIRRELSRANPDRYRPDLARSLSNLGVRFSELGRPADALPVTEEAVTIRRELARANPDRYRPDLAASLTVLAPILRALGRDGDATTIHAEAEELQR